MRKSIARENIWQENWKLAQAKQWQEYLEQPVKWNLKEINTHSHIVTRFPYKPLNTPEGNMFIVDDELRSLVWYKQLGALVA